MQKNKKLFLIDGMALIYRAYYAMIKNPLTDSSGLNTSAIYGFFNSLIKLLKNENPEYISVILDTKAKTFRHHDYKLYKANRKPMPDDLSEQIEPLISVLKSFNIKVYKKDGFEADDIIGTIAKKITKNKNLEIYMYSGDKDFMQLIDEKIMLYSPGNSFKPTKIYQEKDVYDKWGVNVKQFIDYLSLLGDTSDNIPGVKGVGSKTASKLIDKFDTIEQIYTSIDKIENLRLKNMLLENKENAFLSKHLVTINCEVDVKFNLEEMNINHLIFNDSFFNSKEIIYNDHLNPGEGEHKILKYIRETNLIGNSVIYGLDADLIMLGLASNTNNIYLLRESLEFGKPTEDFLYFDIDSLKCGLIQDFKERYTIDNKFLDNRLIINIINDYIFICFFLGNDFLPHILGLDLRYNGLDIILDIYTETFSLFNNTLILYELPPK